MRKGLLALMVVLLVVLQSRVLAAELAVTYVPNEGQETLYIPLEVVPGSGDKAKAREATKMLEKRVRTVMHPLEAGYSAPILGKCFVQVRQLEIGGPVFRMECWSTSFGKGEQGLTEWASVETPDEVLASVRQFAEKHFRRVRKSPHPGRISGRIWVA